MSLLNENNIRMQFKAGVISEDRFEALMKQLRSEKEDADKYEADKEEMYGLNESVNMEVLMSQIKSEKEASDKYEEEKEELYGLNEGIDLEVFDKLLGRIKREKRNLISMKQRERSFLVKTKCIQKAKKKQVAVILF